MQILLVALVVIGGLLVAGGCWWWFPPAGLVAVGAELVAVGLLLDDGTPG